MQLFGTDLLKSYWAHDVKNDVDATSRRIDVITTSCACWEFAPPLCPPQYSKPWPPQYSKPSYAYDLLFDGLVSDILTAAVN